MTIPSIGHRGNEQPGMGWDWMGWKTGFFASGCFAVLGGRSFLPSDETVGATAAPPPAAHFR